MVDVIQEHIHEAQDGADELLKKLDRGAGARELALAKTKLEEAEMWLEQSKVMRDGAVAAAAVERLWNRVELFRDGFWVEYDGELSEVELVMPIDQPAVLNARGSEITPPWRAYALGDLVAQCLDGAPPR